VAGRGWANEIALLLAEFGVPASVGSRMVKMEKARRTDSAPGRVWCWFSMRDNSWVRLLADVTGLVNQRLMVRNEYLPAFRPSVGVFKLQKTDVTSDRGRST
jgi:hypothetical protein